eukprot:jgi/Botrbrau1/1870/Bobra.146_1s0057.1
MTDRVWLCAARTEPSTGCRETYRVLRCSSYPTRYLVRRLSRAEDPYVGARVCRGPPKHALVTATRKLSLVLNAESTANSDPEKGFHVVEKAAGPYGRSVTITITAASVKAYREEIQGLTKTMPDTYKGAEGEASTDNTWRFRVLQRILEDVHDVLDKKYGSYFIQSSLQVKGWDSDLPARLEQGEQLSLSLAFNLMHPFTWKQPYQSLQVEVEALSGQDVSRLVEHRILEAKKKSRKLGSLPADRALQAGDVAIMDVAVRRKHTGELIPGTAGTAVQMDTEMCDDWMLAGVEGMRVGETRSLDPEPSSSVVEKYGGNVSLALTLRQLQYWILPEETDEWAKATAPGVEGVLDWRERLQGQARAFVKQSRAEAVSEDLITALAHIVDADFDQDYLRSLACSIYKQELVEAHCQGHISRDSVKELSREEALAKYSADILPQAALLEMVARADVAVNFIFQQERLSLDVDRIEAAMEGVAEEYRAAGLLDELKDIRMVLEERAKKAEVVKWLSTNCDVKIIPLQQ